MANGLGTATIDFGSDPGTNEASIAVTGQGTISATSKAESYVMADDTTADKTASDHRYFAEFCGLTCGTPTAGVGFTIYGRSLERLQGTFALRWVWAD
jgi:hypothetical protein